jgi:integrase/recombinase XerC
MRGRFPNKAEFAEYIALRNLSEHTQTAYLNDIQQFFDFSKNQSAKETLQLQVLRSWVRSLTEQKSKPRSIHRKVSAVRSFALYLYQSKKLKELPALEMKLPKISKNIPKYVKQNEINLLLDRVESEVRDFESSRNYLILSLFYHTGIRRSELLGLKLANINSGKREMKVLGKGNKERIIPFATELERLIGQYMEHRKAEGIDSSLLFCNSNGSKMGERKIYSIVQNYLQRTNADKQSPHALRHSFATHMLQNGADINAIKEMLGHSSLTATQIYAHNDISHLKRVYSQTHPFSE